MKNLLSSTMTAVSLLLFYALVNAYLCKASLLDPNRKNVLTRYKAIDHSEGRSIPETYYVKTCSKTCKIRFGICWKKKTVCHNQLRTRHKTIYVTVKKYHPIYYCRYGWKQKGSECSIPECSGCNGKGSCSAPWKCTCNPGWRGSECESDFNECLRVETNKCEYRPGCNNTRGSFRCTCPDGYRLDDDLRSCNDIDECGTNSHSCSANGFCHNIRGSYRCSCKNGYQLGSDQKTCQDIDECKTYQNDCDYKAGCQNTVGSFKCTCQAGYYLDADGKTCKDVNECDGGNCQQNCVNYPGGYTCSCYSGYRRNTTNVKHCDDIDECFEKKAGCSQICTNTAGGFNCSCHPGYYFAWDEKHCNDIDECSSGRHGCDQICKNALGSYKCGCREGFELSQDGKTCIGKPCLLIYAPVNGNMNCTGHTTEHTCDFTCSTGYKHIGSRIRRCSPSRRWTGKEAKCEPIICPDPPEPSDGFVYSPCDTRFNSECIAGCDDGFHINETSKLRCTVNGRWEPNGVTCKKKKVCEPNPCRHGGECTDINSGHFSCNCSKTGYKGEKCEIGFVTIPDYPVIVADGTATTVKFRVSPPDNEILFTPQSSGVEFNPPYLLFKRNSATSQSVAITSRRPGLHFVRYHLSGSSSASFQIPQQNALTVQASSNSGSDSSAYDNITFPTGCYKLERHQCPRSEVRITALSTKPWGRIFGILATTKGLVSLSNGVIEVPFSTTGDKFRLRNPSSVNNNCGSSPAKKYSLVEMIKRRVLTKSFLNVVRDSFPKWLDLKLRRKLPFRSIVEDDLKTHYLSGKRLVKKVQLTGQPLTDDSLFSLLISPDLDLMVDGDHVSLGFPDREASFSVALELCGTPPYNVVLKPSTNLVDVINQLSVFKQMQANGWSFKIFSMQISKSSSTKRGLTLVTKFSKDFEVSNSIKSRVDFKGTLILNVHDLENIMDFPLDQKWLAKLDGEIILSMEFKVQGEMTNLAIKMPQTLSYATIGGKSKNDCFLGKKENSQGLLMQNVLKENPFLHTELGRFVELDQPSNMSCFLSAILYHEKISNNSRYRESSNGVKMTFHGNLKFGALRFDNLEVELRFENILCQNSTHQTRSKIIAELNGKYGQRVGNLQKNLGIFEITRDSVVDLHIGRETGADSGGSFSGIVNVLGFQDATKVSISQNGLNFFAKGKINGLFYASATFKSNLMPWNRQRFTTTGVFDIRETDDNLNRLLEKEIAKYTDELLTKMKGRFNLSVETESRAKARLMKVQVLREEARAKMNQINVEYRKSSEKLNVARENFNLLVEFIDGYSDEIRQLNQELSTLCAVKDCPKICHEGEHCGTRFKHTYIAVKGRCLETCHLSKQERKEPLHTDAICKNVYCKRIHSKSNLIGAPFVAFGVYTGNPAVVATGVLLLAPWSKRGWKCSLSEEKCTKEHFEYEYVHTPYKCEGPCTKRNITASQKVPFCSTLSCASFIGNVSCFAENSFCKKARKDALEKIAKVKADAAHIVATVDNARQNFSYWNMKREKLSIRILSAKRSFDAYEEAVRNLEKAYNITKENRLKKNRILTKTMMLKNFTSEQSQSHIKITDIGFETKVLPQQDTNVLLLNIKLQLIKKKQELSTLLDFQNLKRSLRSIAKEILEEYVDENAQVTRKKRSTLNKNDLNFEFYTLQSFHRLCSEFSNYKETLSEVVTSLFEMAKNLQKLRNEELERKKSLLINGSAILENFNVNGNKYDIAVNYDSYLNALETDPEVSEAKNVQNEALENEFGAVRSSSILFNKNWLATMESMFAEYSGECSGFEDCMKYIFYGLLDITIGSSALNGDKLREQILNLERKFFNLTSKSDMSVNEAVHVSRDLLRDVKDMSGVEDVCAHAPNITQQPKPFTELGVNETLVLSCGATGDFLVYQWRFNGEVLTNQRTNILRINNTSPSHSGNYSCDASNHIAKASSIVAVVVIGTPPLIVAHPIRRLNVVLSEYSSLHCKVEEDARNTSFQWWFKSPNSSSFVLIPNEKFSYLSFVPVKLHNEGWYFCNVSNSFGHTISKLSFVQVLKYSLPVPVAKLSLTIISKYPRNETLMNYRDALANNLESRLVILKQRLTSGGELVKDLHATECNIITEYNDELERTQICDWTFRVFGENVTSTNKFKGSAESQDAEKLLNASYNLKNYFVEQIDNNLNAFRFNFFLGNSNHSTMRNSLRVLGISLICPKGQFFVDNVYKCAQCPPGFQGVLVNGTATCAVCPRGFYQSRPGATFCNKCPQGFTTAGEGAIDEKQCEDIDECTIGTGKCDGQATCNNTIGSYSCGCDVGYVQNETMCVDVDECTLQTDNCGSHATCSNTIGSFTCDCNEGYSWKGITCVDVDECTLGTDNCHSQATCRNTIGSFTCDCNEGYSGNGITCVDVDECTIGADNCGSQATCRNTIGSFTCNCNEGYSGNGITCVDVDECTNGSDNCHNQATCSNTMGSFKCTCNEGYTGSGTTCVAEKKYFLYLYLVNEHHKDAIVTINISGRLEKIYLKSTTTKVISKVWTTRSWLTASAVEAGTYRALEINRQSVIRMEPTTMKHLSVKALVIGSRTY